MYSPASSIARSQQRAPVPCAVCAKLIEHPTFNQRVHAGECHREWNRRNSEKFHAKQRKAKAAKKMRRGWKAAKGVAPERDAKYLAFIRTFACIVCSLGDIRPRDRKGMWKWTAEDHIEAAHSGPHAVGRKASDYSAIPLCAYCHRLSKNSYHNVGRAFFEQNGLDRNALIAELRAKYAESRAA